ncbi:MAG: T9SS type A sorting domain-containing protein [Chitinophagaceae bacterium]|nr:T9SS type A sorting domain-containing protein [Chitinophagaceae bacterium]
MKIFYPLIITLLLSFTAKSQDRPVAPSVEEPGTTKIIKFYPNPATSIINFDFQKGYDKSYNFQIFNFLGKKVFEVNNVTPRTIVNLTDFYRGVYIFQLKDKSGKMVDSGKFQVSK